MIYKTLLLNFHQIKYEGTSLKQAKAEAIRAGFESVIYQDEQPILSYSPVGGWRGLSMSSMG
jgi:hypothetical protein